MAVEKKTTKRKKIVRNTDKGQVHILSSFNNNHVCFTDMDGNVISWSSSGVHKFRGSKKSTPYAAQQCVQAAGKVAREQGIKNVEVYVKGIGSGRDAAIRELGALEFNVVSIKDVTPVAHNGCRPPKVRRL